MSLTYVFGQFSLDPIGKLLFFRQQPQVLGHRAVALLALLVERHGELVTKNELIEVAWKGRSMEDSNLTVQIASLRRFLSMQPGSEQWIETFSRRGYRFVGPVEIKYGNTVLSLATTPVRPISPPTDMPSIAVLPFRNQTGDPAHDYLAEGFAEDITSALARLNWLVIIARHFSARLPSGDITPEDVQSIMGVRYVLEGATRLAGTRLRVTIQVSDAETGKTILAQTYERDINDLFAVQDGITDSVVAAIEPQIVAAEGSRAASRPAESLDTWGLVAQSLGLIHRFERRPNAEARSLLQRAIALDPGNARAFAMLSWAEYWAYMCFWAEDGRHDLLLERSSAHGLAALRIDPDEPWARMVYGFSLSTKGEHCAAVAELRHALELNRSFAIGRMLLGWALIRKGDFAEALVETGKALRLSPVDRFRNIYVQTHGLALLALQRFDEALPFLRSAALPYKEYMGPLNGLISCCGHLGLLDEARTLLDYREKCLGRSFALEPARLQLAGFAHAEIFLDGLAKAGVPELEHS